MGASTAPAVSTPETNASRASTSLSAVLDRLQVLAREADVQPAVLPDRSLPVASVASTLALTSTGGLPLAALDGVQQLLLVGISFMIVGLLAEALLGSLPASG